MPHGLPLELVELIEEDPLYLGDPSLLDITGRCLEDPNFLPACQARDDKRKQVDFLISSRLGGVEIGIPWSQSSNLRASLPLPL